MAEEQIGLRKEDLRDWAPWTRLFTAFKVALDPKKLLLAAGGILAMALGWWLLSALFFWFNPRPPVWTDYRPSADERKEAGDKWEDLQAQRWKAYKSDLNQWNFLYRMAGRVPASREEAVKFGVGDIAQTPQEYEKIEQVKAEIEGEVEKRLRRVQVVTRPEDKVQSIKVGNFILDVDRVGTTTPEQVTNVFDKRVLAQDLANNFNAEDKTIGIEGAVLKVTKDEQWQKLTSDLATGKSLSDIENEIARGIRRDPEYAKKALELISREYEYLYKPAGLLRSWPWFEYRGSNPLLLAMSSLTVSERGGVNLTPEARSGFLNWLLVEQPPVLLEPLYKFVTPVVALLHPAAGGMNRVYLLLVILWTLAVWAFFGGAITRMAAVQVARHNEKVGLMEAVRFATARYRSYFAAQLLPLAFLAGLALLLFLYGLVEVITFFLGDIIVAGLGLPLALLCGLVMAVVLVGLLGWPLMFATISTEGSDSFDAISRSYSYVYQAPWSYLWYSFVAILYGAALIFFVGLMGSLTVYLTKWGMTQSPGFFNREPTYLFAYAPTSYGWRDLLLYQSEQAHPVEVVLPTGRLGQTWELTPSFASTLGIHNHIGMALVSVWVTLLFLLVIGFGYSYFWTASSIIYLLMRRKVDDTEMDEIHLEEEELDMPYSPPAAPVPAAAPAAPPPPAERAGATPLTMVEPTAPRASATASVPPPAVSTASVSTPATPPPATATPSAVRTSEEEIANGDSDAEPTRSRPAAEPGTADDGGPEPTGNGEDTERDNV